MNNWTRSIIAVACAFGAGYVFRDSGFANTMAGTILVIAAYEMMG